MKVVVRRTSKKILSIRVQGDMLIVDAHKKLKINEIKEILESKRDWISAHTQQKNNASGDIPAVTTVTTSRDNASVGVFGKEIGEMFCGRKVMLNGFVYDVLFADKVKFDGQFLYITGSSYASKEGRLKALKQFVKKFSAQTVAEKISDFGCCVSLCPSRIEFKRLADGWLKCSSPEERCAIFDYRISQLPEELQHYLIVHSFSHFSDAEHDDKFWNTLSNYLPEYKKRIEDLRQYDFLKEILP